MKNKEKRMNNDEKREKTMNNDEKERRNNETL